jgi:hypothetical protein
MPVGAFPPAPHHLFMGMVRDELGNPLMGDGATVILESPSGVLLTAPVRLDVVPGINYRVQTPMDAGITPDLYQPSALLSNMPFRMRVEIEGISYLPIEMVGDFSSMGEPGSTTILNLTLGADLDGDGIPDAWEEALLAARGGEGSVGDVDPNGDDDGDGLSNLDEYLSGNYAFDENDGLALTIVGMNQGSPVLEWLAIRGRTYTVLASADMKVWDPVEIEILLQDNAVPQRHYYADDVRQVQARVSDAEGLGSPVFFKLVMQ